MSTSRQTKPPPPWPYRALTDRRRRGRPATALPTCWATTAPICTPSPATPDTRGSAAAVQCVVMRVDRCPGRRCGSNEGLNLVRSGPRADQPAPGHPQLPPPREDGLRLPRTRPRPHSLLRRISHHLPAGKTRLGRGPIPWSAAPKSRPPWTSCTTSAAARSSSPPSKPAASDPRTAAATQRGSDRSTMYWPFGRQVSVVAPENGHTVR